jgi:hypothetical protein
MLTQARNHKNVEFSLPDESLLLLRNGWDGKISKRNNARSLNQERALLFYTD